MLRYKEEINKSLEKILENFITNIDEFEDDTDLSLYGMNSLRAISLVVEIENEFGIEVDDEDLKIDNVNSIRKINDLIIKYLGGETKE